MLSPFFYAIINDQLKVIRYLLDKKIDFEDVDNQLKTCVHLAASIDNEQILTCLLEVSIEYHDVLKIFVIRSCYADTK